MVKNITGFTLVELLIVIMILSILATMSFVTYSGVQGRAVASSLAADLRQWKQASEAHKIKNSIDCPDGYAFVYGNPVLGSSDFCVMKYEAKNVGGVATAQADGTPWVSISLAGASAVSSAACGGCHLITEVEWMTIAADVLSVRYNWSGNKVGAGYVYSGHNDNSPANPVAASSDDKDGYFATGNSGNEQRRTLYLKSGDAIWDMAGNVSEWTDQVLAVSNIGVPGESGFSWKEWTTPGLAYGNLPTATRPTTLAAIPGLAEITSWDSSKGVGRIHAYYYDSSTIAFARGGTWYDVGIAGIMKLWLRLSPTTGGYTNGFRVTK
jgi:prepilin-type N-terminal cleavage/methylation domain-containing protein